MRSKSIGARRTLAWSALARGRRELADGYLAELAAIGGLEAQRAIAQQHESQRGMSRGDCGKLRDEIIQSMPRHKPADEADYDSVVEVQSSPHFCAIRRGIE